MIKDIFFDLQRFDDTEEVDVSELENGSEGNEEFVTTSLNESSELKDTLSGSEDGFIWEGGHFFEGAGTRSNPAVMSTAGASVIEDSAIFLKGTEEGYTFEVNYPGKKAKDFEVAIKGEENVIYGDFNEETGEYGISGEITIKTAGGNGAFAEKVNGYPTYVHSNEEATVKVSAEDFDGEITYTFADGVDGVDIGIDANNAAVFEGEASNVVIFSGENFGNKYSTLDLVQGATVKSDEDGDLTFVTGDNLFKTGDVTALVAADDVATISFGSDGAVVAGVSAIIVGSSKGLGKTFENGVEINGTKWDKIAGDFTGVAYSQDGTPPNPPDGNPPAGDPPEGNPPDGNPSMFIANTGAVEVEGPEDNIVAFDKITTKGITVNGAKITGVVDGNTFNVQLAGEGEGFKSIGFDEDDPFVTVEGVNSFAVMNGGASYKVSTTADKILIDGNKDEVGVRVDNGEGYTVEGVNGADVAINNLSEDKGLSILSTTQTEGIDTVKELAAGDVVNVENDADGYTAIFDATAGGVITANDVKLTVEQTESPVEVQVESDGDEALVKGLKSAEVTVAGGATYHFKDDKDSNKVDATAGEDLLVYLDDSGNVADVIDSATVEKIDKDDQKWAQIAQAGGENDTVKLNHGRVYESFYDLQNSAIAGQDFAGYDYDDDNDASDVSSAIEISGDKDLGQAGHITMTVGSGTYVGKVPINIQQNENAFVNEVKLDLTKSDYPSTVAIGTDGEVTAAHKVSLSSSSTSAKPSYIFIGEGATGNNVITAGGAAMIRHEGLARTSIFGGKGNDTIDPDENDFVYGGEGADLYYDFANYAIQDYDETQDALIATRLKSLDDLTPDKISGTGNRVAIAGGGEITIADSEINDALKVKVAAMDEDANVLKGRANVVLANGNGLVDATFAGSDGALILAGTGRGDGVHTVKGSEGDDVIVAGANDSVNGGAGDDLVSLDAGASGAIVAAGSGNDTVVGWQFGFDRVAGNTKLDLGGKKFAADIIEDQIVVSLGGGNSVTFADTKGEKDDINLLIDDKKYKVVRTDGVALVTNNDEIADVYWAQADGTVFFSENVTQNLGVIDLDSEQFQNINVLMLHNDSKASVFGSAGQDQVVLEGDAEAAAGKAVSLGAGNDVIYSGGDESDEAGNVLYFGAGDGRDSVYGFNHYHGFEEDPSRQKSDLLVVNNFLGVDVATSEGVDRVTFKTGGQDEVVIYEANPLDVDNNMYRVKINGFDEAIAKIGYSDGKTANTFTYDDEVQYYVGNSAKAIDTLKLDNSAINPYIRLDQTGADEYYRGIGIVDAREVTGTQISISGSMDNNTIYGGGEGTTSHLWGGAGDNLLVGGEGADVFMYYQYSRNYIDGAADMASANHDTINGYDYEKDVIYLGDLTIDDINFEATKIDDNAITVTVNNGGTLTVNGTQETTRFTFSNGDGEVGQVWTASRSSKSWNRES